MPRWRKIEAFYSCCPVAAFTWSEELTTKALVFVKQDIDKSDRPCVSHVVSTNILNLRVGLLQGAYQFFDKILFDEGVEGK